MPASEWAAATDIWKRGWRIGLSLSTCLRMQGLWYVVMHIYTVCMLEFERRKGVCVVGGKQHWRSECLCFWVMVSKFRVFPWPAKRWGNNVALSGTGTAVYMRVCVCACVCVFPLQGNGIRVMVNCTQLRVKCTRSHLHFLLYLHLLMNSRASYYLIRIYSHVSVLLQYFCPYIFM